MILAPSAVWISIASVRQHGQSAPLAARLLAVPLVVPLAVPRWRVRLLRLLRVCLPALAGSVLSVASVLTHIEHEPAMGDQSRPSGGLAEAGRGSGQPEAWPGTQRSLRRASWPKPAPAGRRLSQLGLDIGPHPHPHPNPNPNPNPRSSPGRSGRSTLRCSRYCRSRATSWASG